MKIRLLFFVLLFALPAQAQDFQKYINSFPLRKQFMPPYAFDSTYWAQTDAQMSANKLKRIPHDLVKRHINIDAKIIENSGGSDLASIDLTLPEDAKIYEKSTLLSYYFLERIELTREFSNLIVYYSDETFKKAAGKVNKAILLLNYDKQGTLISAINLAKYQTASDLLLHTTTIDGNYTVSKKETSYMPTDKAKSKYAFNFREFKYFKLKYEEATFYVEEKKKKTKSAYAGLFRAENEQREIKIVENNELFKVIEVTKGESINLKVSTYSLEKGTFKAANTANKELWSGEFSADKNTLVITTTKGKVEFKRVEK